MDVSYKDNKLDRLCNNQREAQRKRPDLQKKLRLRHNALRAAQTLGDLPIDDPGGAWHGLSGDLAGLWAGELSGNWRLLVEPNPNALTAVHVTVINIGDYH